jgi:CheY-like chemotaxis protein
MESNGFQVSGVTTGKAFFAKLKKTPVDLIILDLNLPDGDGLEFAAELRKTDNTPIIIASARKGMEDRLTALNLGAIDYVTKPFDPQELYLRIKNLLNLTENVDYQSTEKKPDSARQNGQDKSQVKYFVMGAAAVIVLIVVAAVAWDFGRSVPKIVATKTVPSAAPATVAKKPVTEPKAKTRPVPATIPIKPKVKPQPAPVAPSLQIPKQPIIVHKALPKCAAIPKVDWWSNKSHVSIRNYVNRRHTGDWKPYIDSWDRRLDKLVDILSRGSKAVASSGVILSGEKLEVYIGQVKKRISVIKCLSKE